MAESLDTATSDEWARLLHLGESADFFSSGVARSADPIESAAISIPDNALNGAEGVHGDAGVWPPG
jgi:hypothetical protein